MHQRAIKKTYQAVILITVVVFASCATWNGRTPSGRPRSGGEKGQPVPKEVKRPGGAEMAAVSSPARSASMDMVYKGKSQLDRDRYEKAFGLFQEAVVIDSTNGVAYYYLAKTKFLLNQYEESLGILEKAEALLENSPEWMEAVTLLKAQIQDAYITSTEAKESDLIPIINRKE